MPEMVVAVLLPSCHDGVDGNSENDCDNAAAFCDGCMEAVYFGSGYGGGGKGPWVSHTCRLPGANSLQHQYKYCDNSV